MNKELWEATRNGDIDSMKTALAIGAQVNYREHIFGYGSSTCLHVAADNGHLEATKLLLEEGANVDALTGTEQYTPMMLASRNNGASIVRLLLEHNARTDLKTSEGWTVLHWAAYWANLSVVQLLVGKSNVNARDNEGKTPLGRAEERNQQFGDNDAVIQSLKQNGATL